MIDSIRDETIYEILLENSPDAVYCLNGVLFKYVNQMGAKMLGYDDPKELLGKNAMDTVHPDYRQLVIERNRARQKGDNPPTRYESKLLKKDGESIDVEFNISSIMIDGKRLTITYARNIEERVRHRRNLDALHENINRLNKANDEKTIIDTTLDAMNQALEFEFASILMVQSDKLVIITKNPEINGRGIPLDGKGLTVRAAKTQSTVLVEDTRLDPDYLMGSQSSLSELDVPVIVDGNTVAVLNVEQNIVNAFNEDHKTLLETLASHVSTAFMRLDKEKELETLSEKHIKDLVKNYQRISTMVRHDLRSPLQTINNAVEILLMNPNNSKMRDILKSQIKYIESILKDWENQTINGAITRKEEIVESLVQAALISAIVPDSVKVNLDIEKSTSFNLDYNRMLRALSNIIKNSLDAMPTGGKLTISAHVEDDKLVLQIIDTGIGLPKENMDLLYDPFFTTKDKGMGLGLSLVRQVVETHNGVMSLESEAGKGTSITIQIPRR